MRVLRFSGASVLRCWSSLALALVLGTQPVLAQDTAAVWRTFAENVEVGSTLKVRLHDGRTFTATLVEARPDVLLLQRKTRRAVPVESIAYDAIVSLERDKGGISAGKAAAIGVAAGAASFLAILLIVIANVMD